MRCRESESQPYVLDLGTASFILLFKIPLKQSRNHLLDVFRENQVSSCGKNVAKVMSMKEAFTVQLMG